MKSQYLFTLILTVFLVAAGVPSTEAGWRLELESGVASSGYNDIRIPGDVGTEWSFVDDLEAEATPVVRGRLTWLINSRHALAVLIAPLQFDAEGSFARPVNFNGETFAAGERVSGTYRFDSYRLTYRYRLVRSPHLDLDIGFTGKIRDAEISLKSTSAHAVKTNTGFVPLASFRLEWRLATAWSFLLDGDALAAPQGRAEDVLAAFQFSPGANLRLHAGYRILEGGAENDEVYSFTLVNYAVAGLTFEF